jgi:hypothetical protein
VASPNPLHKNSTPLLQLAINSSPAHEHSERALNAYLKSDISM